MDIKSSIEELNQKAIDLTQEAKDVAEQAITEKTASIIQNVLNIWYDRLDSIEDGVGKLNVDGWLGPKSTALARTILNKLGLPEDRLDGPTLELLTERIEE